MATFTGTAGADRFIGGANVEDFFNFRPTNLSGVDVVKGGTGTEVDLLRLTATGTVTSAAFARVTGIEEIQLAAGGNNIALVKANFATSHDKTLTVRAGAGSDRVNAIAVTDDSFKLNIIAGAGNDTLYGGDSADTFHFAVAELSSGDTVAGRGGADILKLTTAGVITATALTNVSGIEEIRLAAGASTVTLSNAFVGSAESDVVTIRGGTGIVVDATTVSAPNGIVVIGSAASDVVAGGAGNDILYSKGGVDLLSGGAGDDVIYTGAANLSHGAQFYGDDGNDRLEYNVVAVAGNTPLIFGGEGNDTLFHAGDRSVTLNLNVVSSDQSIGDFVDIRGMENADWTKSSGSLTATGSNYANVILGGDGQDLINGNGGADILDGGANRDVLGGSGTATAIVDLTIKNADQTIGDAAIVRNFEAIDWSESSGSLTARGTSGIDIIIGGKGTDHIEGGRGADILTGGLYADVFTWRVREAATDELADFTPGTDKLQFDGDVFDFNGPTFNVTVTTTTASAFSVGGADLIRLTDTVNDFSGVAQFLTTNGTGTEGEGVFVIAQAAGGASYLYHVEDAGNPDDIVRIADLGNMPAPAISSTDFLFM